MAEHITGDSISKKVAAKTDGATDLSDLSRDLTKDHASRPSFYQKDLAHVNEALHAKHILPGVDIVGMDGKDLIGKGADGKTFAINAQNVAETKALGDGTSTKKDLGGGRMADMNADGSGTYKINKNDSPWTVAQDILKAQGHEHITNNQIGNFMKELHSKNPHFNKLHPGDSIDIPPSMNAGDKTRFDKATSPAPTPEVKPPEVKPPVEAKPPVPGSPQALDEARVNDSMSKVQEALPLIRAADKNKIQLSEINEALQAQNVTPNQREGLEYLKTNYPTLSKETGGMVSKDSMKDYQDDQITKIRQKYAASAPASPLVGVDLN